VRALTNQKGLCLIISDLYGLPFLSLSQSVLRNVDYAVLSKHGLLNVKSAVTDGGMVLIDAA
jgi:hypothetical protein